MPLFFIALALAQADAGDVSGGEAARLVIEEIGYGVLGGVAAGALGAAVSCSRDGRE